MQQRVYVVEADKGGVPKSGGLCRIVPKVEYFKWRRGGYVAVPDDDGEKRMAKQGATDDKKPKPKEPKAPKAPAAKKTPRKKTTRKKKP